MSQILMLWGSELQKVQVKYMTPHLRKVMCSQWCLQLGLNTEPLDEEAFQQITVLSKYPKPLAQEDIN
jgi:hypothetical protein